MRTQHLFSAALAVITFIAASAECEAASATFAAIPEIRQFDLASDGKLMLIHEAQQSAFFLLGDIHGTQEIPALLESIWPSFWKQGYRHVAAEMSPWAADAIQTSADTTRPPILSLWTSGEVAMVLSNQQGREPVIWGCDGEELQLPALIRELLRINPGHPVLEQMSMITTPAYSRASAPDLLALLRSPAGLKDLRVAGESVVDNLRASLEYESDRLTPDTRLRASTRREQLMKDLLWRRIKREPTSPVLMRFGRNHLHRGFDRRGVSTLGNFVAEVASVRRQRTFHLAAFAGGGQVRYIGRTEDADERRDDPAFEYLASLARFDATIFDLRPVRQALHRTPTEKRTAVVSNLLYWADSYDAILYYKRVTPLPP